jgi:HD-like signal output (HDOD) protein
MQYDRNKLIEVVQKTGADDEGVPAFDMLEAEQALFGATHQQFGAGLCQKWKFPATFGTVTGHHHNPMECSPETRTLPALVYVADRVASEVTGGFRLDLVSTQVAPEVLDLLKLTPAKVEELRTDLPAHLKSVESMLS